ncbi:MAG TPA: DUF456 family protein [Flavobacterium sp.]|nr:DUF456 family protein [Flavobacterium sp.]HQW68573.1 DUF456 family protein [Flavobacterium sp.]
MDVLLLIVGFVLMILGLIGSFLPVLPGVPLCWLGLLLLYFTEKIQSNYWVLGITLIITIIVTILDYVIPAKGTKKFGGTKYGIWGTNIGLVLGLFFPPVGFIVGPFLGAFVGELIYNSNDKRGALKAAIGSFIGFLVSTFMKFMVCLSFLFLYIFIAAKNFI